MSGHSTIEVTHLAQILMEKYKERKRDLHMVFTYLEKVYDKVPREVLWQCLESKGVPMTYIRTIKDRYHRFNIQIDDDVAHRTTWMKMRLATDILCDKKISPKLKVKNTCDHKMRVAKMRILREMCGYIKSDKIMNEDIWDTMLVTFVMDNIRKEKLR
ncbi:hypothetical protein H5410_049155 [Solanum commersonii]|uniref:Reverse transcriptase domain-containing protein n=1 Tax=Solanum commersonii TaxID=4109 RepID=A0A9J5XKA8_SOLCO|nr:hypothetical protein H5410_049155 [Solanum commersonii]